MEDELYGWRLRRTSAVQVCMTCLDTDSNMYSMSEYRLVEVYEDLIGYPLFDMGNLKHTLCEECALILTDFNKFRDKSLRARALIMDFVKQHKVVSAAALRPLQAALAPRGGEGEPAVKAEGEGEGGLGADSVLRDAKLLDGALCRVLLTRMSRAEERALHKQIAPLPARLATNDENNLHPDETEQDETIVKYEQMYDIDNVEADNIDAREELRANTLNVCFDTTCDALTKSEDAAPEQNKSLSATRKLMYFSDSSTQNNDTGSEDFDTQTTSQGEFPLTEAIEPVTSHTSVDKDSLNTDSDVGNIVKEDNIVRSFSGKLAKHIRSHTEENLSTCKLCHDKFKKKSFLVRHMRTHTGEKSYVCNSCHNTFTKKNNLVKHMRIHTGEKPFACELCPYKSTRNDILVRHMRRHTGEKPFACDLCQYKCTMSSNLVKHRRTHTGEKPFACALCQYKCTRNSSLVQHMRIHTGENPFACDLCQYKCTWNSSFVKHMRTHTGEKPFACDLCQYKCMQKSNLVLHMRKHTGEKPFACKLCPLKCTQKCHFVLHMRTHTGEKPFACELCHYKCTHSSLLVRHMRTHTGEKPFACELCPYKCTRNISLDHMRTHTGEKPFVCSLCNFKCAINSNLVRHMRTHTGESTSAVRRVAHRSKSRGGVAAKASDSL